MQDTDRDDSFDTDQHLFEKERTDWIHFLNEVIGPFAMGAALSVTATKNTNMYALMYFLVIFAMTAYRTSRYNSMYFQLSKNFNKNIGEEFTYTEWGNRFIKLKDIKCMWLYILGFMSLGSMMLINNSDLESAGNLIDRYFWVGALLIWLISTIILIRGYLKRKVENRRIRKMLHRNPAGT